MKKITILIYLLFLTGCGASVDQRYQEVPAPETPPPSETTPPSIQLSTTGLSFASGSCNNSQASNPASQTFQINNAGDGTLAWSIKNIPSWLMLTPTNGTAPTTVTAQIDTNGLSCGQTLSQTINIDAPGASNTPAALMVTLSIPNPPPPPPPPIPAILTDKLKVTFTASTCGGMATSASPSFTISSDGGSFNWSGTADQSWIQFSPTSGSDGTTVTVANIDTSTLPCGATSSGTITLSSATAGNSPKTVTVEVVVPRPLIVTNKLKVTFTASSCGGMATSASPSFTITSDGGTFNWSGTGNQPWIQFAPTNGASGATVTVSNVDTANLPCGTTSSGTISISSAQAGNSPQSITVEVVVPPAATINPSTSALGFFASACKVSPADPQQFTIQNNGGSPLSWSADVGAASSWVSLDTTSGTVAAGTTSGSITVTVDASNRTCGQGHSATITITATSGGSSVSPVPSQAIRIGLSNPAAWEHQNPKPTGDHLKGVSFSEAGVSWTVGEAGIIFRSTDAGDSWIPVGSGTSQNLNDIRFRNNLEGWIVGKGGMILHTTDGGATWSTESSPVSRDLFSVSIMAPNYVWAVGDNGTILYRDPNNMTWTNRSDATRTSYQFSKIVMNDPSHGWIAAYKATSPVAVSLLWTDDNWATPGQSQVLPPGAGRLSSLFFLPVVAPLSSVDGWAVGDLNGNGEATILQIHSNDISTPGTITMVNSGLAANLLDVYFSDLNKGWAVGDNRTIITTSNGGTLWSCSYTGQSSSNLPCFKNDQNGKLLTSLKAVTFNNQTGLAVGFSGVIIKTTNGVNWTDTFEGGSNRNLSGVSFAQDAQNNWYGWAVGEAGTILSIDLSPNGSGSWAKSTAGTGNFTSVSAISSNDVWAVNDGRQIYHYSNGSWGLQMTIAGSGNLKGVHFVNATNGWAVGRVNVGVDRHVYYYNGTSWSAQTNFCDASVGAGTVNGVYFLDTSNGWTAGNNGWIGRTTDGGATWSCIQVTGSSPTIWNWNAVYFINASTGWAVGNSGKIYRTTDGGATWIQQPSSTSSALFGLRFSDANKGWAVGAAGMIVATQNGGANWTRQSLVGTTQNLNGLYFTPGGLEGWAVGANGVILHTVSGGAN